MKFGPVPLGMAEGAVLAHSLRHSGGRLKKGTRLSEEDIRHLRDEGVEEVIVARLETGDVDEDAAAAELASAVAGIGVRVDRATTGRANLFATSAGVLLVDGEAVDRFNRIDEGVTLATLPRFRSVTDGEMVATVKIIPFGVSESTIAHAKEVVADSALVEIRSYRPRPIGVVSTVLRGTSEKMLAKTRRVLEERLAPAEARIVEELRVPHEEEAVVEALNQLRENGAALILVYGASAIVDRADVIPAAIEGAGGRIIHLGMPVDPGNLLLVGDFGGVPVIGAPGCARSPKENGFDWVLQRILADLPVGREEVTAMGVGGLLMEIESRPQPREKGPERPPQIAAVVLAAGRSRRMEGPNKLLEEVAGRPLIRIAVEAALASRADPVVVVTGHQADRVHDALAGLDVSFAHNPDYGEGLSTSLRSGIAALPANVDGALICLADMPGVSPLLIDRLIDAYDPAAGRLIILPTFRGKRGNPILWSRRYFAALSAIRGDVGARHLVGEHADAVFEIEMEDGGVLRDVDTPETLARLRMQHVDGKRTV